MTIEEIDRYRGCLLGTVVNLGNYILDSQVMSRHLYLLPVQSTKPGRREIVNLPPSTVSRSRRAAVPDIPFIFGTIRLATLNRITELQRHGHFHGLCSSPSPEATRMESVSGVCSTPLRH